MTKFETVICQMAEEKTSWEIEALIAELQMIAERKYSEEESRNYEIFPWTTQGLNKLSIFA